ncbi:MAG: ATP synthase F0 subunit B [Desulfovibrio sp.]|jgi:F-type H+-transporting ATPase subunit b|nr:ATP synthase F0 subunit B [Desulfovibrio sp.]
MLELNITLFFQLANFFIAIFILNLILIRPIRDIIKQRNGVIDKMTGEADTFEQQAASRLANYETELVRARQNAGNTRNLGRKTGVLEQQNIVGAAQQNARAIVDDARGAVRNEAESTLKTLRKQVAGLSAGLADRLIKG